MTKYPAFVWMEASVTGLGEVSENSRESPEPTESESEIFSAFVWKEASVTG